MKGVFKIFIELDQPQRDLDGLLFFTNLIKGEYPSASIFLVPRDRLFVLALIEMPDVVIFAKPQSTYIPLCRFLGAKIVIHDNEGIPYDFHWLFFGMNFINRFCVSYYWLWGEKQLNYINSYKSNNFPRKKLIVSGGLRYEFYKYLPKSNHTFDYQFNTNYPQIDPKYNGIFSEIKMHMRSFKSIANDYIESIPIYAGKRERLLTFIGSIKDKNKIRIRPHPFEGDSYYKKVLPLYYSIPLSNIDFITKTDIHDDLNFVSKCFNSGCQTTLDSLLRGAIPVSLEKSENIWDQFSFSIDEANELSKLTTPQIHKKILNFSVSKGISNYLLNFSNGINIKQLISPLIKKTDNRNSKKIISYFTKRIGYLILKTFYSQRKSRTSIGTFKKRIKKVSPYFLNKKFTKEVWISNNNHLPYLKQ